MEVRPLQTADVEAVLDVSEQSLWGPSDAGARTRQRLRVEHLLETDPEGAWVAADGGTVVGVAMALRRERLWGLSLMSVLDAQQGKGLGAALLERALAYGRDAPAQIVISSEHPAAMRLYARAGLDIHPCVSLFGAVRHRPVASDAVREVDGFEPWMDEVAREVRGAGYGADPVSWLAAGQRLRCVEGRGWSSARGGRLGCLLARDEEAAHALLEAHLAQTPAGENVVVDFITAGQDWAVAAGLRAGLALSPDGPIFTRGELGTRRAWLPSGAYL